MNISKETLHKKLSEFNIKIYETTDSTNTAARNEALFSLIVANSQSSGRGRCGKSFFSPHGGIYMSLVLPVTELATVRAAVCLCHSIESMTKNKVQIKWVNDIFSKGKKVAGILCERFEDKIIVGIGINTDSSEFPPDLQNIAGNVDILSDRESLIADIAKRLTDGWQKSADLIIPEYESRLFMLGKRIEYIKNHKAHKAIAVGINSDGNLIVSENGNKTILNSGEITLGSDSFAEGE